MARPLRARHLILMVAVIALAVGAAMIGKSYLDPSIPSDWDPKWRHIDWIVRSGRLIGLSRQDLFDRYGEPTQTTGHDFRPWDLVYVLGPERAYFQIDYEWLVLRLRDGKVVEARVVPD